MSFNSTSTRQFGQNLIDSQNNQCRQLLLVEDCLNWKIHQLSRLFPQYCWKYSSNSSLLTHQFDHEDENLPSFYGRLIDVASPFDISIRPIFVDKHCSNLKANMGDYYKMNEEIDRFEGNQLLIGIACACKDDGSWYRGKIINICSYNMYNVHLIDYGWKRKLPLSDLRKLKLQFGRLPPMALSTCINKVEMEDITPPKLEQFQSKLKDINHLARVQLVSRQEPHRVNLYHPTIAGENICEFFYKNRINRLIELEDDVVSDLSCEEEEDEEEGASQIYYLKGIGKPCKLSNDECFVVNIENPNLIYLENSFMRSSKAKIEQILNEIWDELPSVPNDWIKPYQIVAIDFNKHRRRVVIESIQDSVVLMCLIDYGRLEEIGMEDFRTNSRLIPEQGILASSPQIYCASLLSEFYSHLSATNILKGIVSTNDVVTVNSIDWNTRNMIPTKCKLFLNRMSLEDMLNERLSILGIDVSCKSLIPFDSTIVRSSRRNNSNLIYTFPRCLQLSKYGSMIIN